MSVRNWDADLQDYVTVDICRKCGCDGNSPCTDGCWPHYTLAEDDREYRAGTQLVTPILQERAEAASATEASAAASEANNV